ncbi:hypothetical protein BG015_010512 [Linnemannia schmuckeri]|uniref:Uncharacterized protein n=1 Tax=Linnemannia schmuckeri TaxID=64567 RepID=A0A9P5RUC7_9FUNG|nr:hypothetical protein BG015_010512 [Linnemannia schmuckeri]
MRSWSTVTPLHLWLLAAPGFSQLYSQRDEISVDAMISHENYLQSVASDQRQLVLESCCRQLDFGHSHHGRASEQQGKLAVVYRSRGFYLQGLEAVAVAAQDQSKSVQIEALLETYLEHFQ